MIVSTAPPPELREAERPPEQRGIGRDRVLMLVADPADGSLASRATSTSCPSCSARPTCSSSTPRARCRPRCRPARPAAPACSFTSRRPRPARSRDAGSSSCERATAAGAAATPASACSSPPAARLELLAGHLGSRLWVADLRLGGRDLIEYLEAPRAPDPLRPRGRRLAARRLPERLCERAGQRRDAERGPALHGRGDHAPGGARRRRGAGSPPHRRVVARARRAALPRALRGLRGERRAHQPRALARRPRDRRRHHLGARTRVRGRTGRARARRGRLDAPRDRRRAAPARRRRRPERLSRPRLLAPAAARGASPAPGCSSAPTRAPREHGYLRHEFGDVLLVLPG